MNPWLLNQGVGRCLCKEGFDGADCGRCSQGYYDYPECKRCPCDGCCENSKDCICEKVNPRTWNDLIGSFHEGTTQKSEDCPLKRCLYLSAPKLFLGDKMKYYSGFLKYIPDYNWVKVVELETNSVEDFGKNDDDCLLPDVIIEGKKYTLGYKSEHVNKMYSGKVNGPVKIELVERDWIVLDQDFTKSCSMMSENVTAKKYEFMDVLSDVRRLIIRLQSYHFQNHVWIAKEQLKDASTPTSVEMCLCPCGNICENYAISAGFDWLPQQEERDKEKITLEDITTLKLYDCLGGFKEKLGSSLYISDGSRCGYPHCNISMLFKKIFSAGEVTHQNSFTSGRLAKSGYDRSGGDDGGVVTSMCLSELNFPSKDDQESCLENVCVKQLMHDSLIMQHLIGFFNLTFDLSKRLVSVNLSATSLHEQLEKLAPSKVNERDLLLLQHLIQGAGNQVEDAVNIANGVNRDLNALLITIKKNVIHFKKKKQTLEGFLPQKLILSNHSWDPNYTLLYNTAISLLKRIRSNIVSTLNDSHELKTARKLKAKVLSFFEVSEGSDGGLEPIKEIVAFQVKFEEIKNIIRNVSHACTKTIELNRMLQLKLGHLKSSKEYAFNLQKNLGCDPGYYDLVRATWKLLRDFKSFHSEDLTNKFALLVQNLKEKVGKWSIGRRQLELSLLGAMKRSANHSSRASFLDKIKLNFSLSNIAQKTEELQRMRVEMSSVMLEAFNASSEVFETTSKMDKFLIASVSVDHYASLINDVNRVQVLALRYENVSSVMHGLNGISRMSLENDTNVLGGIQNNSADSNEILKQMKSRVETTLNIAAKAQKITKSILYNISSLRRMLPNRFSDLKMITQQVNITVLTLSSKIEEIQSRASGMSEKVESLEELKENIKKRVAILQTMIQHARGKATNVKAPLCHKGSCIRSYPLVARSSLTNSIVFSFKTDSIDDNQLLLLINDRENLKFIAVELLNRRIKFSWRIGKETSSLKTLEGIQYGADHDWYRMRAERIGHVGRLWLYNLNGVKLVDSVVRKFNSIMARFDVKPSMDFFIGGAPLDYQLPVDLSSRDFSGCIGEVMMDGFSIGMFDFQKLFSSSWQTCYGSPFVPHVDDSLSGLYKFDGTGHAVLKLPSELSLYTISLTFKVFWRDALLFCSVNNDTGEFVLLELKDGHVVFSYGWPLYGFTVSLTSEHVYNHNKWVKVFAMRTDPQGVLRVEDEDLYTPLHDAPVSAFLNLSGSPLYFGGIPDNSVDGTIIQIGSRQRFLGCMKDITIDSHFILKLLEGMHTGLRAGCSRNEMKSSGFTGSSSFLELEFHHDSPSPTFSFLFRTSSANALLLLSVNEDYQLSFLVQVSSKGGLEALIRWNERIMRFEHHEYLCDDNIHSVFAYEGPERLKLMVDQFLINESYMDDLDGFHFSSSNVLFVGGVPSDILEPNLEGTFQSFRGCIFDLIVNDIPLSFDAPKSFHEVDIGRCQTHNSSQHLFLSDPLTSPTTVSTGFLSSTTASGVKKIVGSKMTPIYSASTFTYKHKLAGIIPLGSKETHSCGFKKAYQYEPNAVSFGTSRPSYVLLNLRDHTSISSGFKMCFHLRSHNEEGVLLHSLTRDSFMWSISFKLGHVVVLWGHPGKEARKETRYRYDDGHWVQFEVSLENDFVKTVVDETEEIMIQINNSLGFDNVCIGKRTPESYQDGDDVSVFRGCIANFSINNELIHLANLPNMVGLLPCHSHIEKGAFFDGYAYALFAEHFHFKSFLTISFNIKLHQPNGVIFVMSDFHKFATLVIVLDEEQVIFKVSDYGSMYSAESEPCSNCLCDGLWHHVVAELFSDNITIGVDGRITSGTRLGNVIDLELGGSLFIGGNPASISQPLMPESGDFFSGCLANVRINDEPIDWWNAEELFGIHLGGCPILS